MPPLLHFRPSGLTLPIPLGFNQASYVAQGLGISPVFTQATFHNGVYGSSNPPANDFAPTTNDFVPNWISNAAAMKAKYIRWVCKHQDGFCLWPTATTAYSIASTTWYQTGGGFDIAAAVSSQARTAGLNLVPSFQCAQDTLAQCKAQLVELVTNYGPFTGLWWDFKTPGDPSPFASLAAILTYVHSLQPNLLLVCNVHPGNPNFGFGSTDILEYEFGFTVPSGNSNYAEKIDTIFTGFAASQFAYTQYLNGESPTAATSNTITFSNSGASNVGMDIVIDSGTGAGQRLTVASHSGTTLNMSSNWTTIPDGTSVCHALGQLKSLASLQSALTYNNNNDATYLQAVTPDMSGHIPSDQAALVAAFGASH